MMTKIKETTMKTKNNLLKLAIPTMVILFLVGGITNAGASFIIGGYFSSGSENVSDLPLDKITHINYAFAIPRDDGSLEQIPEPQKLSDLISAAHIHGIKVSISVVDSRDEGNGSLANLSSNPALINNFANNIANIVDQYNLDGVDIDWEYPHPGMEQNYVNMMKVLSETMHSRGKLLTAAVASEGDNADVIASEIFDYVDWLNIMSYDNADGPDHATYEYAISNLDYWQNRGLPISKTVLGVPFYASYDLWTYRDAIEVDKTNANNDCATVYDVYGCYNGIPTIKKKTELLLQRGAGLMAWELSQDTTDDTSLINAMNIPSENLALNKTVTASSTETSDFPPNNAVDNSATTRWSSNFTDDQWIQIDLGNIYTISGVRLSWEDAFGESYKIQISGDGNKWEDIYNTSNNDGGIDDISNLSGSGRYIRMYGMQRGTEWGYSLWEFDVYGKRIDKPWTLVWSDEFDGPINTSKWEIFEGSADGNTCFIPDAVTVSEGQVHFAISRKDTTCIDYGPEKNNTQVNHNYVGGGIGNYLGPQNGYMSSAGRWETRARFPLGEGTTAYIAITANDIRLAEIDFAEAAGLYPRVMTLTQHWNGKLESVNTDIDISQFHTYAIEVENGQLKWYVDDNLIATQVQHFNNMELGFTAGSWAGNCANSWPGCPSNTSLPAYLDIDYTRIYSR
jgi:hypothetical protein